jgi:hypothetical protein
MATLLPVAQVKTLELSSVSLSHIPTESICLQILSPLSSRYTQNWTPFCYFCCWPPGPGFWPLSFSNSFFTGLFLPFLSFTGLNTASRIVPLMPKSYHITPLLTNLPWLPLTLSIRQKEGHWGSPGSSLTPILTSDFSNHSPSSTLPLPWQLPLLSILPHRYLQGLFPHLLPTCLKFHLSLITLHHF